MELFVAGQHYGARPGWHLYEAIKSDYPNMMFFEEDVSVLGDSGVMGQCNLLILNLLPGDDPLFLPGSAMEKNIRQYLKHGGNMLLLHCGSAAFERWDWWHPLVGLRWVRSKDPRGESNSMHPVRPYQVKVVEGAHPLSATLCDMDLPEDEIYIHLEHTCPVTVLMETSTDEGTFCQCCESNTPWDGRIVSFLPGHAGQVVRNPDLLHNVGQIIDYLKNKRGV